MSVSFSEPKKYLEQQIPNSYSHERRVISDILKPVLPYYEDDDEDGPQDNETREKFIEHLNLWIEMLTTLPVATRTQKAPIQLCLDQNSYHHIEHTSPPYTQYFTPIGYIIDILISKPCSKGYWKPGLTVYGSHFYCRSGKSPFYDARRYLTNNVQMNISGVEITDHQTILMHGSNIPYAVDYSHYLYTDRYSSSKNQDKIDKFLEQLNVAINYLRLRMDSPVPWSEPVQYTTTIEKEKHTRQDIFNEFSRIATSGLYQFKSVIELYLRRLKSESKLLLKCRRSIEEYTRKRHERTLYDIQGYINSIRDNWNLSHNRSTPQVVYRKYDYTYVMPQGFYDKKRQPKNRDPNLPPVQLGNIQREYYDPQTVIYDRIESGNLNESDNYQHNTYHPFDICHRPPRPSSIPPLPTESDDNANNNTINSNSHNIEEPIITATQTPNRNGRIYDEEAIINSMEEARLQDGIVGRTPQHETRTDSTLGLSPEQIEELDHQRSRQSHLISESETFQELQQNIRQYVRNNPQPSIQQHDYIDRVIPQIPREQDRADALALAVESLRQRSDVHNIQINEETNTVDVTLIPARVLENIEINLIVPDPVSTQVNVQKETNLVTGEVIRDVVSFEVDPTPVMPSSSSQMPSPSSDNYDADA